MFFEYRLNLYLIVFQYGYAPLKYSLYTMLLNNANTDVSFFKYYYFKKLKIKKKLKNKRFKAFLSIYLGEYA